MKDGSEQFNFSEEQADTWYYVESTLRSSEKRGRIKCPSQPSPLVSQHRFKAPSVYSQFQLYGKRVDAPRSLKFLVSPHRTTSSIVSNRLLIHAELRGRGDSCRVATLCQTALLSLWQAHVCFPASFFEPFGFSKWDQGNEFIGTKMSCFVTNKARE